MNLTSELPQIMTYHHFRQGILSFHSMWITWIIMQAPWKVNKYETQVHVYVTFVNKDIIMVLQLRHSQDK